MKTRWMLAAVLMSLVGASTAWAHPAGPVHANGWMAGLAHPWLGLDHVLVMVAVGLLAMQFGGRARCALPATFLSGMAVGLLLPIAGGSSWFEIGVAASVVGCGVLLWADRRAMAGAFGLAALFGLLHGHVHATESLTMAGAWGAEFVIGVLLATAALHGVGLLFGALVTSLGRRPRRVLLRACAAVLMAAGAALMAL